MRITIGGMSFLIRPLLRFLVMVSLFVLVKTTPLLKWDQYSEKKILEKFDKIRKSVYHYKKIIT